VGSGSIVGLAVAMATLGSAVARGAETPRHPTKGYTPPSEAVVVAAEEAPVELGGTVVAKVKRGRRLGVRKQREGAFQVQVFTGRNLRHGWVDARHVKVVADGEIDLAREALLAAREVRPKLDVAACHARLDALTARAAKAAQAAATPAARVQAIGRHLFGAERCRYEAKAHYLSDVIDRRRGNCLSLSLLYVLVGRRLKMPMRVVTVPKHAFVRYDDGQRRWNIEASMGGMMVSDEYVRRRRLRHGVAPKLMSDLEVVAAMLAQAGNDLSTQGAGTRACELFATAAELAPRNSQTYHNWGTALLARNQRAQACDKFSRALQLTPHVAETYYTWGVALAKLGEHEWACEKFASAAKADPTSPHAYFNWGIALLQLRKPREADEKLDKAVALLPALKPQVQKLRAAFRQGTPHRRTPINTPASERPAPPR